MTKNVGIKFVGSKRATETVALVPGNTVSDVLTSLGLDTAGYALSDARNPDNVFRGGDDLYARVNDGDMLYASANVTAGV